MTYYAMPVSTLRAEKFVEDNLLECAKDILEWQDTAILKDGKFRELARIIHEDLNETNFSVARSFVISSVLRKFVKDAK